MNDGLEESVIDLSLVEAAQEEHDGLADALDETFGTHDGIKAHTIIIKFNDIGRPKGRFISDMFILDIQWKPHNVMTLG